MGWMGPVAVLDWDVTSQRQRTEAIFLNDRDDVLTMLPASAKGILPAFDTGALLADRGDGAATG